MDIIELLRECKLQLEYLNEKFGETGTTNALLAKINTELSLIDSNQNNEYLIKKHLGVYTPQWIKDNVTNVINEAIAICKTCNCDKPWVVNGLCATCGRMREIGKQNGK